MNDPQLDREEIRAVLDNVAVALQSATVCHPERLDVRSIIEMQATCRDALAEVMELRSRLADPDDPIITDD